MVYKLGLKLSNNTYLRRLRIFRKRFDSVCCVRYLRDKREGEGLNTELLTPFSQYDFRFTEKCPRPQFPKKRRCLGECLRYFHYSLSPRRY